MACLKLHTDNTTDLCIVEDTKVLTLYKSKKSAYSYDSCGMVMNHRQFTGNQYYRFGFQDQKIDKEFWNGAVSFKYRFTIKDATYESMDLTIDNNNDVKMYSLQYQPNTGLSKTIIHYALWNTTPEYDIQNIFDNAFVLDTNGLVKGINRYKNYLIIDKKSNQ